MRILFLSFYYSPDLCAGSFRATQLVNALLDILPEDAHIDVISTQPNRYSSYHIDAPELEESSNLTIHRIKVPAHKSGMLDQMWSFLTYIKQVRRLTKNREYQLIYGTSSRLMTAALSAYLAHKKSALLYLDIRDIFVDTLVDISPQRICRPLIWFFSWIERISINRANKINLVSEGFKGYFEARYPSKEFSYFTNCIASEFIGYQEISSLSIKNSESPLTVLYAGNIGEGQGLHKIIPELAKHFEGRIKFCVFGDGGRKAQLERRLSDLDCKNVELLPPIGRSMLRAEYQKSDVLFVHLNNFSALEKVLPSKLFEYAAMGKPILAGVSGYAAKFVNASIDNSAIFEPCNVSQAIQALDDIDLAFHERTSFVEKYSEATVLREMASDILNVVDHKDSAQ